ncbi:MAG: protein kinase domain-containing protein, partial [Planctomycetota bacterium]
MAKDEDAIDPGTKGERGLMSQDLDLRMILLGLRRGDFTLEQVFECEVARHADASRSLSDLLQEMGYLPPDTRTLLEARANRPWGDAEETSFLPSTTASSPTLTVAPPPGAPPPPSIRSGGIPGKRYRTGEEIGRGGLGRVLSATDTLLGRPVAVKEMTRGSENPGLLLRFLREGRIAGRLMHPNIVPVFDIGILRDPDVERPYFVMGKITGRDLRSILDDLLKGDEDTRRDFSRPRLLRVFQEICQAVAYAHDNDVIHRDLKPANVMVGGYGEVYVVDWGLARILGETQDPIMADSGLSSGQGIMDDDSTLLTMAGDVLGTPSYMPPEQASGRVDEVDKASDIYSLGAVLYEILTLSAPFEGDSARQVLPRVVKGGVTPPSRRVEERGGKREPVPPELDEICLKALSWKKTDRHPSALALSEEIQAFLEGEKEKERNHQLAREKLEEGRKRARSHARLKKEAEELRARLSEAAEGIEPHWPVERKRAYWALQDEVRQAERARVEAFAGAE